MESLNYHNLRTFWTVAREGGVVAAGEKLLLAQPTVSGQIRQLEKSVGQKLFARVGRRLVLTETGRIVFRYADDIFAQESEFLDGLAGLPAGPTARLNLGVADVIPKSVAFTLLNPAMSMADFRFVCHEGKTDQLLAELALHRLDVVLSDVPLNPALNVRAFSHHLGTSGVAIVGVESLAAIYRDEFPQSLHQAPFFLPVKSTMLRRSLDQWFEVHGIRPQIRAEFDDSALMKFFGREGGALFPVPTIVQAEVCRLFSLDVVGTAMGVGESFYAISLERRLRHPAVLAICERARQVLKRK